MLNTIALPMLPTAFGFLEGAGDFACQGPVGLVAITPITSCTNDWTQCPLICPMPNAQTHCTFVCSLCSFWVKLKKWKRNHDLMIILWPLLGNRLDAADRTLPITHGLWAQAMTDRLTLDPKLPFQFARVCWSTSINSKSLDCQSIKYDSKRFTPILDAKDNLNNKWVTQFEKNADCPKH